MVLSAFTWLVVGCGPTAETVHEVDVSSQLPPAPASLTELAANIRSEDGTVFVGSITADMSIVPERAPSGPDVGLYLSYPRTQATVSVTDALGGDVGSTTDVIATDGPPVVVDEAGTVQTNWSVSGINPSLWEHRWMPGAGSHVFFVTPSLDGPVLRWAARVEGGVAEGDGTVDGADTSLDALRVSP